MFKKNISRYWQKSWHRCSFSVVFSWSWHHWDGQLPELSEALHHHAVMSNISTTQLTHFIMLTVYMSFCRLKHFTEHMEDRNAALLKSTVWISLVIISFRTTFSMKGSHNTINPYFKNLLSVVRRSVHVVVTRYMEQECICQNHVQCDIYPTTLTSEVVLPSYQYFLQHIHQTGMTKKVSNESDALGQYGKPFRCLYWQE